MRAWVWGDASLVGLQAMESLLQTLCVSVCVCVRPVLPPEPRHLAAGLACEGAGGVGRVLVLCRQAVWHWQCVRRRWGGKPEGPCGMASQQHAHANGSCPLRWGQQNQPPGGMVFGSFLTIQSVVLVRSFACGWSRLLWMPVGPAAVCSALWLDVQCRLDWHAA